jgi:hypothetical protein
MAICPERNKLKAEAAQALREIMKFTDRLLTSLLGDEDVTMTPLDKDLENAVGAKERAFGALTQHRKDHGC